MGNNNKDCASICNGDKMTFILFWQPNTKKLYTYLLEPEKKAIGKMTAQINEERKR